MPDEVQTSIDEGLRLYGRGESERAFEIFLEVRLKQPENDRIKGYLNVLSAALGRAIPPEGEATDVSADGPLADVAPESLAAAEEETSAAAEETPETPAATEDVAPETPAAEEASAAAEETPETPAATEDVAPETPAATAAEDGATVRISDNELAELHARAPTDASVSGEGATRAVPQKDKFSAGVRIGVKNAAPFIEKKVCVKSLRFGSYWDDDDGKDLAEEVENKPISTQNDILVLSPGDIQNALHPEDASSAPFAVREEESPKSVGVDVATEPKPIEKPATLSAEELAADVVQTPPLRPNQATTRLSPADIADALGSPVEPADAVEDAQVTSVMDNANEMDAAAAVAVQAMLVNESAIASPNVEPAVVEPVPLAVEPVPLAVEPVPLAVEPVPLAVEPVPLAGDSGSGSVPVASSSAAVALSADDLPPLPSTPASSPENAAMDGFFSMPSAQVDEKGDSPWGDSPWGDDSGRGMTDLDSEHSSPSVFDMLMENTSSAGPTPAVDVSTAQIPSTPARDPSGSGPSPVAQAEEALAGNNECDVLMEGARELFALGDFSGSLELVEKVLEIDESNGEARQYLEKNEATLLKMYESKLGNLEGCPRPMTTPDEVIWLNMHHRAGFVLSQVDGMLSYEEIADVSGLPRLETFRILVDLQRNGVIGT
ncbi:MAG: hypothetical protein GY822_09715 [Deltaproteobacteria bacterium]|nr:hypothetical protein [Deltaproteobacteria bacterium]